MDGEKLERALVTIIEATGIPAQPYPEKPEGYFPEADPGEVLVRYEGKKALKRDVSGTLQRRELYVEIVVVSRQLRGENGLYSWLEVLDQRFEGYTLPQAAGPMQLDSEGFVGEENGTWQFAQKWKITENAEYGQNDEYADRPLGDQGTA